MVIENYSLFSSSMLDKLSDDDLRRLNELLPWSCFILDSNGRKFGTVPVNKDYVATKNGLKRNNAQIIPDPRISYLHNKINLSNKSVLEVGCYEGIHTIALSLLSKEVYAVDSRIENVVKTITRANIMGFNPIVSICNLEDEKDVVNLSRVDVVHHVGVLYHLTNPVKNLYEMSLLANKVILLDTHYATEKMINNTYIFNNNEYKYYHYSESGRADVFSGMNDHAKWLLKDDIINTLKVMGFSIFEIIRDQVERNGPRFCVLASKY